MKILFIVFISLLAVVTPSCTEGDNYSFDSMDDGGVPGSRPKINEKSTDQFDSEAVLIEITGK